MKKILLLFSGGLDSILSYKILKTNNFIVKSVQFYTPFLHIKNKEDYIKSLKKNYNIELELISVWSEYQKILLKPKYGYGENLNPCIDCKLLFYRKAKEIMEKENLDYIATGEIAGQRPFSQRADAIRFLEKNSGLKDKILRPLCKSISAYIEEVNFYNIKGRGRKQQIELATQFNLKEIPTPSGGCLLTEPSFCEKIKSIINFFEKKELKEEYFEIIKHGRLFAIEKTLIIIGRDKNDGERLMEFHNLYNYPIILCENFSGPVSLILSGKTTEKVLTKIKEFVKKDYREKIKFKVKK